MRVKTEVDSGVLIAAIKCASLSEYESGVVLQTVLEQAPAGCWRIALDFSDVTFLASAGIGMIVRLHRECINSGGRVAVFGLNDQLATVMKTTKMDKLFPIVHTREKAIRKLA